MYLLDRLNRKGPKRILSLDGGGVRGILSLGFLARIEMILQQRLNKQDLVLADYFDLIGGTSTGAIIAAALAQGHSVRKIQEEYLQLGKKVFEPDLLRRGLLRSRYKEDVLEESLSDFFGDETLGSENIKTGLCIVTKRADTNSVWPFFNHPEGRYYEKNKGLLLRNLVLASTAAPSYFESKIIPLSTTGGLDIKPEFIDGGVSMFNNPAMLLFMLATLKGYPFQWQTGADNLLLVSIGTGCWEVKGRRAIPFIAHGGISWAKAIPDMLISEAQLFSEQLLQLVSQSPTASEIDVEVGNLSTDLLGGTAWLSYLRYDVPLDEKAIVALRMVEPEGDMKKMRKMDDADQMHKLNKLGQAAAGRLMPPFHLPRAFDPPAILSSSNGSEEAVP